MYKVLIVDDNEGYAQSQIEMAANMGIDLEHIDNWADAQVKLEIDPYYYKVVILDGKGKLTKDGKAENKQHLSKAIAWMNQLRGKNVFINYVINTGFYEEIKEEYIDVAIYSKLGEESRMFQDILVEIEKLDTTIIEQKYPDVLNAFNDNYLPKRGKEIILNLLISYERKNKFNKPFNSIRDLLEIICKRANEIDNALLPDELIDKTKNNKPNLTAAEIFFSGRRVDLSRIGGNGELIPTLFLFPNEVNKTFTSLVGICNILSHDEDNQKPNKYAFEHALFGICELIVCFKNYLEKNYE